MTVPFLTVMTGCSANWAEIGRSGITSQLIAGDRAATDYRSPVELEFKF